MFRYFESIFNYKSLIWVIWGMPILKRPVDRSSVSIKVFCVHPHRIYSTPEIRLPEQSQMPCTLDGATLRRAAQSYLDLKLITVVEDVIGRKLDNFSSLQLDWSLSQPQLGQLKSADGVFLHVEQVDGYTVLGPSKQFYH